LKECSWVAPPSKKKERFVEGEMVKGRNEPCNLRQVLAVAAIIQHPSGATDLDADT
jgi:hypothetical protein